MNTRKPNMMLKWRDESEPRPITRADAAHNIRKNRKANPALRVTVRRTHGETYIASDLLGVACCIYREGA